MTLVLLSGPAIEPLTLAEAKSWLRVTDGADDLLVQSLIVSARLAVEAATGRLLITQQWRWTFDAWPDGLTLTLPLAPVRSILHLRAVDLTGVFRDVAPSLYTLDAGDDRARVIFSAMQSPPGCPVGGVQVDLAAGYGDAASAVPEPLRLAMRQLIAFWHANRGDGSPTAERIPVEAAALLAPFRTRRLA